MENPATRLCQMVLQGANGFPVVFSLVGDKLHLFVLSNSNSFLLSIPEAMFEGHAVELCLPVTDQIMQTYELAVESSKQLNDLYFSVVLGSGW